jgi:hypothetical protein
VCDQTEGYRAGIYIELHESRKSKEGVLQAQLKKRKGPIYVLDPIATLKALGPGHIVRYWPNSATRN